MNRTEAIRAYIRENGPQIIADTIMLAEHQSTTANRDYADRLAFGRKCLVNVASGAKFSSDRTICQYAREIWHIEPTQF